MSTVSSKGNDLLRYGVGQSPPPFRLSRVGTMGAGGWKVSHALRIVIDPPAGSATQHTAKKFEERV